MSSRCFFKGIQTTTRTQSFTSVTAGKSLDEFSIGCNHTQIVLTEAHKVFSTPCFGREVFQRHPLAPSLLWRTWTCPRFPATSTLETSISKCRASPRSEQPAELRRADVLLMLLRSAQFCCSYGENQSSFTCVIMGPRQLILFHHPDLFIWTGDKQWTLFEFCLTHVAGWGPLKDLHDNVKLIL